MGRSPQCYIPSFVEIGQPVLEKKIFGEFLPYEPRHEKTGPGLTQTWLYSHETLNFGFRKKDCTICVAKTKGMISCAVTAQLICIFVFRICKTPFFSWCCSYMDMVAILVMWPICCEQTFVPPTNGGSTRNLVLTGQVVWRRKCLSIVNDRRTDTGAWIYYQLTNEPSAQVS